MRYICERLLKDVVGGETSCKHKEEYDKLIQFCSNYPNVNIRVEDTLMMIEKQWVSIAKVIVAECHTNRTIPTLFAATKNIMETYAKVDPEIARYHATWLDIVITELENRHRSSFFYFIVFTVMIFYISK